MNDLESAVREYANLVGRVERFENRLRHENDLLWRSPGATDALHQT